MSGLAHDYPEFFEDCDSLADAMLELLGADQARARSRTGGGRVSIHVGFKCDECGRIELSDIEDYVGTVGDVAVRVDGQARKPDGWLVGGSPWRVLCPLHRPEKPERKQDRGL